MKRYYFSMETELSLFLGVGKDELHLTIINHTSLGRTIINEQITYESISEIKDCDRMMFRITEFQKWSADQFNYTFEPFYEERRNLPDDLSIEQRSSRLENPDNG